MSAMGPKRTFQSRVRMSGLSGHGDCTAKCPFMTQGGHQVSARPVSRSYGRYAACFTLASKRARAFFPSFAATAMLSKKTGELSSGPGKSPTSMP
jgi:hypothetical protein